jgi:uncharacterized membrane-anchored protein YhcB (DUF1043 family)
MVAWILYICIGVIGGFAAGFFVSRLIDENKKKCEKLENQLNDAKSEMTSYKQNVTDHFVKTSNLINNMTDSYRAIYDHMSDGAKSLCSESMIDSPAAQYQLDIPKAKLIETEPDADADIKDESQPAEKPQDTSLKTSTADSSETHKPESEPDTTTVSAQQNTATDNASPQETTDAAPQETTDASPEIKTSEEPATLEPIIEEPVLYEKIKKQDSNIVH